MDFGSFLFSTFFQVSLNSYADISFQFLHLFVFLSAFILLDLAFI